MPAYRGAVNSPNVLSVSPLIQNLLISSAALGYDRTEVSNAIVDFGKPLQPI